MFGSFTYYLEKRIMNESKTEFHKIHTGVQNSLSVYGFCAASLQRIFKTNLCKIFDIPAYLSSVDKYNTYLATLTMPNTFIVLTKKARHIVFCA